MDDEAADVVGMGGELGHTLEGVEIEDTEHQIIRADDNPILSGNKFN